MINIESATISIDLIIVGDRFRSDMGDLTDLQQSIEHEGLLHPLVVFRRDDGRFDLAAGGRRMAACANLGWSEVPVRIFPPGDEHDLRVIELNENLHRQNLAWQEEVALKKRIHDLQIEEYGAGSHGPSSGWTPADTSALLGTSQPWLAKDLKLAEAMEILPQLNLHECRSKKDALRILANAQELAIRSVLAERAEEGASYAQQELLNSYQIGDFFERVKDIPDNSVDFIDADPPYNLDLHRRPGMIPIEDDIDAGLLGTGVMSEEEYLKYLIALFTECKRILKPTGWIIYWFAMPMISPSIEAFDATGLKYAMPMAIWHKTRRQVRNPDYALANAIEPFFYLRKDDAIIAQLGHENVFIRPCIYGLENYIHPTEKPIELMQDIISTFVHPNALVFVPFLGSGNTLLAAANIGMKGFGYDQLERLKDAYKVRVMENMPGRYTSYKPGESK